jgi:hypothetical protein
MTGLTIIVGRHLVFLRLCRHPLRKAYGFPTIAIEREAAPPLARRSLVRVLDERSGKAERIRKGGRQSRKNTL